MLYIFDLDGTLVKRFGSAPLPGVVERITTLVQQNFPIAVATNQAGIAWRAKTQRPPYPLPEELGARFDEIAELLPPLRGAVWFVAIHDPRVSLPEVHYTALAETLQRASRLLTLHVSAQPDWRKPQPGMLRAACERYSITPDRAVYVGDMESDQGAAQAAGMTFISTDVFFAQAGP